MRSVFFLLKFFLYFIFIFQLSSCATNSENHLYRTLSKDDPKNINYLGSYKIGREYVVKGIKYKPREDKNYIQVGIASWYGKKGGFHGKKTANGDRYNKNLLTAAHPYLPLPSLVKVTNLENKKSIIVMLNDRGPFCKKRIIDVSEKVSEILGFKKQGIARVRVKYLHNETKRFLDTIYFNKRLQDSKEKTQCSINCRIKLINMKYKLNFS